MLDIDYHGFSTEDSVSPKTRVMEPFRHLQEGDDKSGAGPGQDFQRSGQIPLFFTFFRPGPGQVRGKLLVVRDRSGASF